MKVASRFRKGILKSTFIFLNVLFLCQAANASETEPIKILFIGNSYTQMNEMPSLLQKMANKSGEKAIIERSTQSGASFKDHSERTEMYEAIKSRKWDYIVLQGYSRELSYSPNHIDSATVPYLNKIIDSISTNNSCTAVLFFMTWGYEGGYLDRKEVNTYEKMADSIARGYRYLSSLYNIAVVPVGMVWKSVKEISEIDLYAPDGAHPNVKGSYLAACTFYNVLFNEPHKNILIASVSSACAMTIKKEAQHFVTENRTRYKLTNNQLTLIPFTTEKGVYSLTFSSRIPLATAIKWSFGDGEYSEVLNGTHIFKKHGIYHVRIETQEGCGLKTQKSTIVFDKFKKRRLMCVFRKKKKA